MSVSASTPVSPDACSTVYPIHGRAPDRIPHHGPIVEPQGDTHVVTFNLYAPDAQTVDLLHYPPDKDVVVLPMQPVDTDRGWYRLTTDKAGVGSLYHYRIDGQHAVPDPASHFQPQGVTGPSQVMDPNRFQWQDNDWQGLPWEETVIYELHIGTFTAEGTYAAAENRLDHLIDLGVTAIEMMPVAAFSGSRNWGYDGVYPYAPVAAYGTPDDLRHFIQAAHQKGLMVFLDVVYNHFGPDGNFLHLYASSFFTERHKSPWGAGLNLDGPDSPPVREFFIQNALYWLEVFRFDGLRLDAVHTIQDDSTRHMLQELAERVQAGPGQHRRIHLILENDNNTASWLNGGLSDTLAPGQPDCPSCYTAQWNDDSHHVLHTLATGQTDSYYVDYAQNPIRHLSRVIADGFAYQGEVSTLRNQKSRGESSSYLPSTAFICFFQNHDQVGNHPFGSRASVLMDPDRLRATMTVAMLLPQIPMLFMGEEWQTRRPFPFFCDFHDELAQMVREGRRQEFSHWPEFDEPEEQAQIPDPNALETFETAILDWSELDQPEYRQWLDFYKQLIHARKQVIIPFIRSGLATVKPDITLLSETAVSVHWQWTPLQQEPQQEQQKDTLKQIYPPSVCELWLLANWGDSAVTVELPSGGHCVVESHVGLCQTLSSQSLPATSALWLKR